MSSIIRVINPPQKIHDPAAFDNGAANMWSPANLEEINPNASISAPDKMVSRDVIIRLSSNQRANSGLFIFSLIRMRNAMIALNANERKIMITL